MRCRWVGDFVTFIFWIRRDVNHHTCVAKFSFVFICCCRSLNSFISTSRRRKREFLGAAGCLLYYPKLKSRRERDLARVQRRSQFNGNEERWFSLKLSVDLYGGDTFTVVLGRAHALPSRTLYTSSHRGRHNLQILSNPPPPPRARVASTFPPLDIVLDPYLRQLLCSDVIS